MLKNKNILGAIELVAIIRYTYKLILYLEYRTLKLNWHHNYLYHLIIFINVYLHTFE